MSPDEARYRLNECECYGALGPSFRCDGCRIARKTLGLDTMIERVREITNRLTLSIFGYKLGLRVDHDQKFGARVFLQVTYQCTCLKTGKSQSWNGRKWYLSEFMTDDEIVKTAYAAFEATVKHEVMEGFKVDDITLFNPHVDYQELLRISDREVKRFDVANNSTEI